MAGCKIGDTVEYAAGRQNRGPLGHVCIAQFVIKGHLDIQTRAYDNADGQ